MIGCLDGVLHVKVMGVDAIALIERAKAFELGGAFTGALLPQCRGIKAVLACAVCDDHAHIRLLIQIVNKVKVVLS
mgnify:CR=1 FL=1